MLFIKKPKIRERWPILPRGKYLFYIRSPPEKLLTNWRAQRGKFLTEFFVQIKSDPGRAEFFVQGKSDRCRRIGDHDNNLHLLLQNRPMIDFPIVNGSVSFRVSIFSREQLVRSRRAGPFHCPYYAMAGKLFPDTLTPHLRRSIRI